MTLSQYLNTPLKCYQRLGSKIQDCHFISRPVDDIGLASFMVSILEPNKHLAERIEGHLVMQGKNHIKVKTHLNQIVDSEFVYSRYELA